MSRSSDLAALLRQAGLPDDLGALDALLAGTLAAPPAREPDAWLALIGSDLPEPLVAALRERRERLRGAPPAAAPDRAERLARFRDELRRRGVDGFVLMRTDEHGSEYLPGYAERVAWLTGFTGSAATAVVLMDRAAVFTDGRYTVQIEQEVDPALFERRHIVDEPPSRWLEQHLPQGARLGYDPWLAKRAEVQRLEAVAAAKDGTLVSLDPNPVDAIWTDRPPRPIAPVHLHDERYAGESSAHKRERMGKAVGEKGADVLLLTAADSIAWLLNVRGGDIPFNPLVLSYALLGRDGTCRWFVDPRKLPKGLALPNAVAVEPVDGFVTALDALGRAGAKVLVDPTSAHVGFLERLKAAGARLIEGEDPCVLAKAQKNPVEIEGAIDAQRRDGAAVVRFLAWLDDRPLDGSLDELGAAARLAQERAKDPLFRGPSFETISAHGPNAALPHYRSTPSTNRPLTGGTLYLVDSGAQYLDATTDITRTVALGTPGEEMRERFTLVLKGMIAISLAVFPEGTTGAQIDAFARLALWRHGLDFDHGTGHGVGSYLCVHEGPARISKLGTARLEPGMILSNEPGYYKPGAYGIRIENLVAVEPREKPEGGERKLLGFRTLTLCPIDRRLIEPALLTAEERSWLDAYHARVREELLPLVGEAGPWLEAATAPL
ncbi:aminopeptidase P family protein [Benzoatithermus flavus]|uniref:Aminopeptidase P family protein n=1 Tax=Benzoatithermus flavus TaxID=3108223 RepID=A0ABU8XQ65_9PROT